MNAQQRTTQWLAQASPHDLSTMLAEFYDRYPPTEHVYLHSRVYSHFAATYQLEEPTNAALKDKLLQAIALHSQGKILIHVPNWYSDK